MRIATVALCCLTSLLVLASCDKHPSEPATAVVKVVGGSSDAETAAAKDLFTEARNVMNSRDFFNNMEAIGQQYPDIFLNGSIPNGSAGQVLEFVRAAQHYNEFGVQIVGRADGLGAFHAGTLYEGRGRSQIRIGYERVVDFRSYDPVRKSCAINTAAHEISHTISGAGFGFTQAIDDTGPMDVAIPGRINSDTPVASYLIGAVAQCSFLQISGRIQSAPKALRDCVEVFGVRGFNDGRCTEFRNGEPVVMRAGLSAGGPAL